VARILRREGLKVPQRQPKRARLWVNEASCVRLRPERANHVWAYDFVEGRTHDGRKIRMLNIVDEFTREAAGDPGIPAVEFDRCHRRSLRSVYSARRARAYPVRQRARVHCQSRAGLDHSRWCPDAYITPGRPWENGYIESFNARLRDEFLNGEIFYTLQEAKILIEAWRRQYNTIRPHSSLGYRPPAPEVLIWQAPPPALKDVPALKSISDQNHKINYI
jgi:putative transposase